MSEYCVKVIDSSPPKEDEDNDETSILAAMAAEGLFFQSGKEVTHEELPAKPVSVLPLEAERPKAPRLPLAVAGWL